MTTRRQFIKQTTHAVGGILLANSALGNFFIGKKPKVIIIGAGFAGLAAAYHLYKNKIDFIILEARNRIGGRVFSYPMDEKENLVIELGAEWVGASHERLIQLCDEFKLELFNNQFDTHLIYKGEYFNNQQWSYSEEWKAKFAGIIDRYLKMPEPERKSLQKKLDKTDWWHWLVQNGCTGRDLDIRELLDSTDFGESIRHVSACAAFTEYAESSPKNEMDFKIRGGNSMLAKKIAEKIGEDKIRLGKKVSIIYRF